MKHEIRQIPGKGHVLWLTDGKTDVGLALDYGIRIVHLSCSGCENLLYEQPADLSDGLTTDQGWRIYGGHRLWTSPESDLSYYPDNSPVSYEVTGRGAVLTQSVDPWLEIEKQLQIDFEQDGSLLLQHRIVNRSNAPKRYASWGVTTFAGGCRAEVDFPSGSDVYTPQKTVALWSAADLSDPRLRFTADRVYAEHRKGSKSIKIGLFSRSGHGELVNKGQRFMMDFEADLNGTYADSGCNVEIYTDANVLELEAVGQLHTVAPWQAAEHWERWRTERIKEAEL